MLWFPPASASLFRHQKRTILVGLVSELIECVLACLCAPTFPLWHLFYVVSYCYVTKLRVLTSPALGLGTTRSVRRNRALVRPWHCRYAMHPPYLYIQCDPYWSNLTNLNHAMHCTVWRPTVTMTVTRSAPNLKKAEKEVYSPTRLRPSRRSVQGLRFFGRQLLTQSRS